MPILLEPRDVTEDLKGFKSVLIVSCPMCPPMSLAMQKKKPFIELFKHGIKTEVFEDYIKSVREPLEQRGVQTEVYTTRVPSPLMCLWTQGQRDAFLERARKYEAVLVMGCTSAISTVKEVLKNTDCRIIPAMRMKAIANATMKFRFPFTIGLDMHPKRKHRKVRQHGNAARKVRENRRAALSPSQR